MKLPKGIEDEINALVASAQLDKWNDDEMQFAKTYIPKLIGTKNCRNLFCEIYRKAFPKSKRTNEALTQKFDQMRKKS